MEMPDIAAIGAMLGSVKTATDIAKLLRSSDFSMEKAELKMKIADLTVALADIKVDIVGVQDAMAEKERRITELEEALQTKGEVVRQYDGIYRIDADGEATGRPFCLKCWTVDHKLFDLHAIPGDRFTKICTFCKTGYTNMRVQEIQPKEPASK